MSPILLLVSLFSSLAFALPSLPIDTPSCPLLTPPTPPSMSVAKVSASGLTFLIPQLESRVVSGRLFVRQNCAAGSSQCASDPGACCPADGQCCGGGRCCPSGFDCVTVEGQRGCCPTGETCAPVRTCAQPGFVTCSGENFCCPPGNICFRDDSGAGKCRDPTLTTTTIFLTTNPTASTPDNATPSTVPTSVAPSPVEGEPSTLVPPPSASSISAPAQPSQTPTPTTNSVSSNPSSTTGSSTSNSNGIEPAVGSSTSTPSPEAGSGSSPAGRIAGGIFGGIVAVTLAFILFVIWRRRRRAAAMRERRSQISSWGPSRPRESVAGNRPDMEIHHDVPIPFRTAPEADQLPSAKERASRTLVVANIPAPPQRFSVGPPQLAGFMPPNSPFGRGILTPIQENPSSLPMAYTGQNLTLATRPPVQIPGRTRESAPTVVVSPPDSPYGGYDRAFAATPPLVIPPKTNKPPPARSKDEQQRATLRRQLDELYRELQLRRESMSSTSSEFFQGGAQPNEQKKNRPLSSFSERDLQRYIDELEEKMREMPGSTGVAY